MTFSISCSPLWMGVIPQDKDLTVGGTSSGFLHNASIQHGNLALTGTSGDMAFAYQFLGGIKTFVTKRLFVFGEYKYFGTKYSFDSEGAGNSKVKLDFQTHIVSGGIGWSF